MAQLKAVQDGTATSSAAGTASSSTAATATKASKSSVAAVAAPSASSTASSTSSASGTSTSGTASASEVASLAPDLGATAGNNPDGTGNCDGAVDGADGKPILVPCSVRISLFLHLPLYPCLRSYGPVEYNRLFSDLCVQCPPDNATYIASLQANVAAGFAVNNTVVAVPFPTDDSSASQATRINAALVTLQNLEGAGKGCPASSTTLLVSVLFPCSDHDFSAIVLEVSDTDFGWVGNVGAVEDCSVRCINDYRRLPSNVSPSDGPHIHAIPPYHHTRIPTHEDLHINLIISTSGFRVLSSQAR